jgi:hypothetical protein
MKSPQKLIHSGNNSHAVYCSFVGNAEVLGTATTTAAIPVYDLIKGEDEEVDSYSVGTTSQSNSQEYCANKQGNHV